VEADLAAGGIRPRGHYREARACPATRPTTSVRREGASREASAPRAPAFPPRSSAKTKPGTPGRGNAIRVLRALLHAPVCRARGVGANVAMAILRRIAPCRALPAVTTRDKGGTEARFTFRGVLAALSESLLATAGHGTRQRKGSHAQERPRAHLAPAIADVARVRQAAHAASSVIAGVQLLRRPRAFSREGRARTASSAGRATSTDSWSASARPTASDTNPSEATMTWSRQARPPSPRQCSLTGDDRNTR
jgi:hypothetical protein